MMQTLFMTCIRDNESAVLFSRNRGGGAHCEDVINVGVLAMKMLFVIIGVSNAGGTGQSCWCSVQ